MIDQRFTTTLTCTDEDCEFYLVPIDVDMVQEGATGAKRTMRERDEFCECGEHREEAIEGVPDQVRRRTVEVAA